MVDRAPFEVDDRFLLQVYRITTVLALIAIPILWAVYGLPASLSFAIGSLLSLSAILSLEFIIRRMVKPGGSPRTKRWLGFIALGKVHNNLCWILSLDKSKLVECLHPCSGNWVGTSCDYPQSSRDDDRCSIKK